VNNSDNNDNSNTSNDQNNPHITLNVTKPPKRRPIPAGVIGAIVGLILLAITLGLVATYVAVTPFGIGVKMDITDSPLPEEFHNKTPNISSAGFITCFDPPDSPGTYQVYITQITPHTVYSVDYGYTEGGGRIEYESLGKIDDNSVVNTTILYNGIQMACVNIRRSSGSASSVHLVLKKL
jgi:hypothetical protein